MFLLYHAYVYLEFLILACTIYILAPLCIVKEDKWQVYYSERGNKSGLKIFETETEACEYFLGEIKRYATK